MSDSDLPPVTAESPLPLREVEAEARRIYRRMMRRIWLALASLFMLLAIAAWATDFITLKGERTIYTVMCRGTWRDDHCAGKLVAGKRIRFRALKAHREVIFWTIGEAEPAGKLSPCLIRDGRNWFCEPGADSDRSVAVAMVNGQPQLAVPAQQPFREVSKARWLLLRYTSL